MFSTSPSLSKTNPQSPEINIGTNITCKQTQFEAKQNDRVGEGGREGERERQKNVHHRGTSGQNIGIANQLKQIKTLCKSFSLFEMFVCYHCFFLSYLVSVSL